MQRQQTGGRGKAVLFMVGALLVAGLVSYLVWSALQRANAELQVAKKGPKKVPVVVALHDLHVGIPLAREDLEVVEILPEMAPAGQVFSSVEDLAGARIRTPREKVLAGEYVRDERLADEKAGIGLNAIITRGKRAMTIDTDAESSLAGLLQPGNYVDVIVTIRPDDQTATGKWVTETILQWVKVLAVSDSMNPTAPAAADSKAKKSTTQSTGRRKTPVTLELTLEESEKLALAVSRGDIHLVLRSDVDIDTMETTAPITTNVMLGVAEAAEAPPPPVRAGGRRGSPKKEVEEADPNYTAAEVIEGSSTTIELFDESGEKVISEKDAGKKKKGR